MIHGRLSLLMALTHSAYLFLSKGLRDHDAHGPNFCEMMEVCFEQSEIYLQRINSIAGTSISIYHTFHDEVDTYRVHVWQCSGPCRGQPPYFGLVKRSMNRAPGPRDPWWPAHAARCGGTYTKIAGPEPKPPSKKQATAASKSAPGAIAKTDTSQKIANASSLPSSSLAQPGQRRIDDAFKAKHTLPTVTESTKKMPRNQSDIEAPVLVVDSDNEDVCEMGCCPVCGDSLPISSLPTHVDSCLSLLAS